MVIDVRCESVQIGVAKSCRMLCMSCVSIILSSRKILLTKSYFTYNLYLFWAEAVLLFAVVACKIDSAMDFMDIISF